ncbi:hypothetical protein HYT00_02250 [Candidatus Giovannonibacteria bacterium]|nr:hypothetical protein [Candidatus Giovannonibacteria bacterium]
MEKSKKIIFSSAIAASLSVIFITFITIYAEFSVPTKDYLKSLSGHHWTTKSIASVILFFASWILIYAFCRNIEVPSIRKSLKVLIWLTILGSIAILGFFTAHSLGMI